MDAQERFKICGSHDKLSFDEMQALFQVNWRRNNWQVNKSLLFKFGAVL